MDLNCYEKINSIELNKIIYDNTIEEEELNMELTEDDLIFDNAKDSSSSIELGNSSSIELGNSSSIELGDSSSIELGDSSSIELGDSSSIELGESDLMNGDLKEILENFNMDALSELLLEQDKIGLMCVGNNFLTSNSFNIIYKNNILENISIENLHEFSRLLMNHVILKRALEDIKKNYTKDILDLMPIESKEILLKYYYSVNRYNLAMCS
jgi:hypothetical protein